MKLSNYIMRKLKRMAVNMFYLVLGIAAWKIPEIFKENISVEML